MKRARKILTLILVFVLLAGVFSGCTMFTRNSARYRALVAVTVGNEEITVGKVLDSFNNYYNMYGNYIGQGITVDWLLQMSMNSLVSQAMKVDSYVSTATAENHALANSYRNAKYLTKEEIEFTVKYVKYITFQTLDGTVESILGANRTIAAEETPDTSRDFTELDDLEGRTYSEYTYRQRVFDKDAEEYFDKYYGGIANVTLDAQTTDYVYANEQAAKARLDGLNKRLDENDEKITYSEYKSAQEKVVGQYQRSIRNTYGISFEQFMSNQVEDMIASAIAAKYDYNVNKIIDNGDGLNETIEKLMSNLDVNRASQTTGFALNNNFVEFIEGLTSSSYIYNVPEGYQYIFVKNILIPFTAQQKTTLANLAKELGNNTDHPKYVELRNRFAASLLADDFNSEKDEDGNYAKVSNLFAFDNDGKLIVDNSDNGALKDVFLADGTVKGSTQAEKDANVIAYMKRFNTDTAQHTATYDYVVRVGEVPSDYTAKWVDEFVDAANEAWDNGNGLGRYALAISTYGVHIVYYSGDVTAQNITFNRDTISDTSSPEYRLFSAYFSQQSSLLLEENLEELKKSYLDGSKIATTKNFDRFLKDNGFEFDLIKYMSDED